MPSDDTLSGPPLPYMRYAKRNLGFDKPMNLGMSGVRPPGEAMLGDLGLRSLAHAATGRASFVAALGARFGVAPEQVHPAVGASHANFVVALARARGGRILVEEPGYEALRALGPAVGASVGTLPRRPELQWAFDPDALEAAARDGADLVFVTDLHNPSGRRLGDDAYAALARLAEATGAWIVVDEIYADFDPVPRPSAVHRHPQFVVTSSLTKVHGLGDLRAGWVLAAPEVIARIDAWDDVVSPAHSGSLLHEAATYMAHAVERAAVARDRAAWRQAQVQRWIDATAHVGWLPPHGGITGFVRVGDGAETNQGDRLASQAAARHGVVLVPGSYFQRPAWVRLSFDVPEEVLGPALDGVALAARELFG